MQVDFHAAIMVSNDNLEEDSASTPTMSGFMKDKKAELYFSTGESTTNVVEASTTPRQRPNMPGMESLSASHQKTPKMSNMRHLLGPLTEDLASPPVLLRPTPWKVEAPRKMITNDTSSSSSNNADSNTISGDPSDSSQEIVNEKQEYRATATSAKKEQLSKTPGAEQTLVVKHLLGRDQENKNVPHAVTQLRKEPKRQQSFEIPVLGIQRAPDSGGVIWNLDTPLEQTDPQQLQNANLPPKHVSIPACCGGMTPASSTFNADPWSSAMATQSLPSASRYAPTSSHVYGGPMQSSLQPQTAEQHHGTTMGVFMGSSAFAPGTGYYHYYSQPQDAVPAHHSSYSSPQSYLQHEKLSYHPSKDMHIMRPAITPASMVRLQVPRVCHCAETMHNNYVFIQMDMFRRASHRQCVLQLCGRQTCMSGHWHCFHSFMMCWIICNI